MQNVYVGWQSSSARRVGTANLDIEWMRSQTDLPCFFGRHWQRFFPSLEEALSQDEAMICARAQVQADFTCSVCRELSPQQEAQYMFWMLRCHHIHPALFKDDWHSKLLFWRIEKFELLEQPLRIPSRVTNRHHYISVLPAFVRDELIHSVAPSWFSNTDILIMVPMSIALLMPEWKMFSLWSPPHSRASRRGHIICERNLASDDRVSSLLPPHPIMPTLSLSPSVHLPLSVHTEDLSTMRAFFNSLVGLLSSSMAQHSHLNGAQQKTVTQAFISVMAFKFALDNVILERWKSKNTTFHAHGTVLLASFLVLRGVAAKHQKKHAVDAFTLQMVLQGRFKHEKTLSEETLKYAQHLASELPGSTTLWRAKLKLTVAWMMAMRKWLHQLLHTTGLVMYMGVDSSPIRSQNFEIIQAFIVPRNKLSSMFDAVLLLRKLTFLEPDEREEEYEVEVALMRSIEEHTTHLTFPVVMLPDGEGKLNQRWSTLLHSFRCYCFNFADTAKLAHSSGHWLTDQGTEFGFGMTDKFQVDGMISYFNDLDPSTGKPVSQKNDLKEDDLTSPAEVAQPCEVDMSHTVPNPGMLHILHGCVESLRFVLKGWSWAVLGLQGICAFLSSKGTKSKLLERCYDKRGRLGCAMGKKLRSFSHFVYTARWGTVMLGILLVLDVWDDLCWGWNIAVLLDNVADAEVDNTPANDVPFHEQRYSKKVAVVEFYLNSDRFRCWLECMNATAKVHQKSIEWNESCDCHWHLLELAKKEPGRFSRRLIMLWKRCPLRGCRASSIVMGCFQLFMIEMFDASAVKLMSRLARYSPEDRDFGMADFTMSRLYIQTHMAIKLTHVGLFPHHAYGLAHHDASKAQQCHSALTTELLNNQIPHKMVAEFGTGSLENEFCQWGIEELCNWQADDPPHKLEELKSKLGEFVLVRTAERWVERPHASTTREVQRAHNHSILHINHCHMWPQISKRIEDLKMFNELANAIDEVHPHDRYGCGALAKLGLVEHPQILRPGYSGSMREQAQIILHADSWTLYSFKPPAVSLQKQWQPLRHTITPETDVKETFVRKITIMHLVNHMKSNQEGADLQAYYSLPFHPAGLARLESMFVESGGRSRLLFNSCGEFSTSISPPLQGQQGVVKLQRRGGGDKTCVIFTLVSARIHSKLVVSVHHKVGSDTIAISLRSCSAVHYEEEELTIDTQPVTVNSVDRMGETFAMSLSSFSVPMLIQACVWEGKGVTTLAFKKGAFPEATPSALIQKLEQSLMEKKKRFADDVMPLVLALQAQGHMNSDHTLTETGLLELMVQQRICNPTQVFSKAVGKKLDEMSMWELHREMMDDKWEHKLFPLRGKTKDCEAFRHGKARVMWQTSTEDSGLFRHYMICLLQCDRNKSPAEVPHFKTDSCYQGLLGKQPKTTRMRKLQVLPVFQEQSWVDDPSVFGMAVPAEHQEEFQTERAEDIVIAEDDDEEKDQSDKEIEWRFDEQDIGDGHEEEEDSRRDKNKRDKDGQSSSSSSGSSSSASSQSTPRCEPLSSQERVPPPDAPPDSCPEPPPPPEPAEPVPRIKRQKMFQKITWFCWQYQEYMKPDGYTGITLHCNLDSHNKADHAPCSKTLSFSVLGHEHTLLCLMMWAVVGESSDDKEDHKAQWKHVLRVYKERGLGYSEDELERRASEVKKREDSKKRS